MGAKHFVAISILLFLGIGVLCVVFFDRNLPPPPINNAGPVGGLLGSLEPCPEGKNSDVALLEPNSRMYDLMNGTGNIKPDVIQLYGIIKNNSKECALKSVTMKFTFNLNGQALQELTLNLLGEVKYPDFALQPQATKEYKEDIFVFESLLTKTLSSTKLRSGVVKKEQIVSTEWVLPPSNKLNK